MKLQFFFRIYPFSLQESINGYLIPIVPVMVTNYWISTLLNLYWLYFILKILIVGLMGGPRGDLRESDDKSQENAPKSVEKSKKEK